MKEYVYEDLTLS